MTASTVEQIPRRLHRLPGSAADLTHLAHVVGGLQATLEAFHRDNAKIVPSLEGLWAGPGGEGAKSSLVHLNRSTGAVLTAIHSLTTHLHHLAGEYAEAEVDIRHEMKAMEAAPDPSPAEVRRAITTLEQCHHEAEARATRAFASVDLSRLPKPLVRPAQPIQPVQPVQPINPNDPAWLTAALTIFGAAGITFRSNGVETAVMQAQVEASAAEIAALSPAERARLAAAGTSIDIIPPGEHVTDVPAFASLAGQYTMDGRLWNTVDGVGGAQTAYRADADGYGTGFVGAHETGHLIENALSPEQTQQLQQLWQNRVNSGGPWLDDNLATGAGAYDSANRHEYFADCTAAFFNVQYEPGDTTFTPQWLQVNDPNMYAFLQSIYPGHTP